MIVIINESHQVIGTVSSNTPQKLRAGEIQVVIDDVEQIELINRGAKVRWDPDKKSIELDTSTIEPTLQELLMEETASLWFDNMKKDLRLEEQQEEIAELWFMLMMLGGAE